MCPQISNMKIIFPTGHWDTEDTASEYHPRGWVCEKKELFQIRLRRAQKNTSDKALSHLQSGRMAFKPKHPLKNDHEGLKYDLSYVSGLDPNSILYIREE